MVSSVRAPFRLRPPDLPDGLVHRSRLLDELASRFDRRLTVVRAGAGFGKTTLLAHAVAENRLDPIGVDVWLQLLEQDRQPEHLLAGIRSAIGVAMCDAGLGSAALPASLDEAVEEVVDIVWARAPEAIALVLDDVHLIDGSDSATMIADLCNHLPANAHLVLGSRTSPKLPVRLMQARGHAVVVDERDLAFTVAEQDEFATVRHLELGDDELPSWPALAVLMSTVGRSASIDFLWEAVMASLPADRLRALGILVRFARVDDELVAAVLGVAHDAASLLAGLPLVESGDGDYRFHDLWRTALADAVPADEWRAALAVGAEVLIARGEVARGARCLQMAGAEARLVRLAREFGAASISVGLSGSVAEVLVDCLPLSERNGALGRYLATIATSTFQSDRAVHDMREVRRLAGDGDPELASLALWRETQLTGDVDPAALGGDDAVTDLVANVRRLADAGWPLARCALGLIMSHDAERRHDVRAALDAVQLFEGPDPEMIRASVTSRYLALGHPEQVAVTVDEVLRQGVSDPVSAQAVWFRGEIDPSVAWPIVRDLPAVYRRRRLPNVQVPLLGVLTSVALAAGDLPGGRQMADDALALSGRLQRRPALFARVADALVTLAADGDDAARARFEAMMSEVPLEPWPAWAYLGALGAIRALLPDTEWLDGIGFGTSITTAVAAGRAVAVLRAEGDTAAAEALPWHTPDLLRVHVPPSMLCELALAAAPAVSGAREAIDHVTGAARWVRRLVDHPHDGVRAAARALTAGSPDRPAYSLDITTLGEFVIRRSDGGPVADRVRGGRVQQLVARLLIDGRPTRTAVADRMWPDLSEKQAAANLRVTLASLLDAIEPDRAPGTSWFVESTEGRLGFTDDGIAIDVLRFEDHVQAAREAERASRLTLALDHHAAAFALYRGEFMRGVDDGDVTHERLRLLTLGYNSGCRQAELLLARGEPEAALRVALDAARIDPLAERARRAEIRCHLALGSTQAARTAVQRLRTMLDDERLRPDRETEMLFVRLDA